MSSPAKLAREISASVRTSSRSRRVPVIVDGAAPAVPTANSATPVFAEASAFALGPILVVSGHGLRAPLAETRLALNGRAVPGPMVARTLRQGDETRAMVVCRLPDGDPPAADAALDIVEPGSGAGQRIPFRSPLADGGGGKPASGVMSPAERRILAQLVLENIPRLLGASPADGIIARLCAALRALLSAHDAGEFVRLGERLWLARVRLNDAALAAGTEAPVTLFGLGAMRIWSVRSLQAHVRAANRGERAFDLLLPLQADEPVPPLFLLAIGGHAMVLAPRPDLAQPDPGVTGLIGQGAFQSPEFLTWFLRQLLGEHRRTRDAAMLDLGDVVWRHAGTATTNVTEAGKPFGCAVENVFAVPGKGYLVTGWIYDPHALLVETRIRTLGGEELPVRPPGRFERADVLDYYKAPDHVRAQHKPGFFAFVASDRGDERWPLIELVCRLRGGMTYRIRHTGTCPPPAELRLKPLSILPLDTVPEDDIRRHIRPVVAHAQRCFIAGHRRVGRLVELGTMPERPALSIVVPLYKNLEFVRHQLAHFAADPALAGAELVYVLDSPEQQRELETSLRLLTKVYRVPARLAVHEINVGYAGAINTGVAAARGDAVILGNSDVIPKAPGWSGPMLAALRAQPGIGAVGPRLLFYDGSVEHAGMRFATDSALGVLVVDHPEKGLPVSAPSVAASRRVEGVSGAWMMVDRALFAEMGGISEDFIIGDFEDAEFCLRLAARGLGCWYCAEAELYHLQRQSMGSHAGYGRPVWAYNRALFQDRMDALSTRSAP